MGETRPMLIDFSKKMTYEERKLAEYLEHNSLGSFYTAFWKAVTVADLSNLARLRMGFPAELAAWDRYMKEGSFWRPDPEGSE